MDNCLDNRNIFKKNCLEIIEIVIRIIIEMWTLYSYCLIFY